MKITLTKVFRSNKDKNGKELKTSDGRPYTKLAIKAVEYGDKWLSGFDAPWNGNWREGDIVDAEVEQKGDFLNLKRPDPLKALELRIKKLEDAVFSKNDDNNPF